MFTAAAAAAFAAAVSAIVSAGTAIAAIAAIAAAVVFSVKVAVKKGFAFSAGKNFGGFFLEAQAGGSVPAFFINAMVTNKVPVGNFPSAFAGNGYAVGNKIMSPSAVFTSAFMFHKVKSFS